MYLEKYRVFGKVPSIGKMDSLLHVDRKFVKYAAASSQMSPASERLARFHHI